MKKLANKTAVITGGNSGIGFATAQEFIAQGAKVIITGRNQKSIDEAVAQLGESAFGVVADSNSMQQIKELGNKVKAIAPQIDIVFINAGMGKFNSVEQMTEEMFDEIMDINFKGAYFSLQQLLPLVKEGGSIVFNTSINAHIGMAGASVYAASKAALLSLTKNLAAELLPRKIRVNAVSPGPVGTPFHSTDKLGLTQEQLQQMGNAIVEQVPIGRFGTMEELAKVVTFFASDDSTFLLGSELIADGGMYNL
ncbi:NAD(P)-dependent dehydrogenase (short-subunit alcohol dehydrogenase family) [Mucilaginibacter yixingensis]|uniref:NAD(P)-dependent dehydrogenase (Short-subunit alcohol dehydrogenase family) n=1 Tax=Mucilaginibacter yixingensis TaxID=1295612 RepID=A0A2T5J643_9SPHI|nr:SDR family oxidoreductase [Mucilaginibacter yixingensis]PTQ94003.1 NAD(P)-dependent dehydrogenase (short-subunit alcohol dehydrogenase family) [Mucilaginibacter yixingensis]